MNYFFIVLLIAVYFIQAFTLGLAGKPHNQVILENTLDTEHLSHPEVTALATVYKKQLFALAVLFSFLTLPLFIFTYESLIMTFFWFLLLGSIGSMFFCRIYYIRQMHRLIVEKEWLLPVKPLLVDTQLILQKNKKMVSGLWFLPPFLVWIAGSIYTLALTTFDGAWLLVLLAALLLLLSFGSWIIVGKLPVRPLTEDRQINQQYNDLTKHHWSFLMLSTSWILPLLLFFPAIGILLSSTMENLLFILLLVIVFLWTGFTFWYLLSLRKKQDQLLAQVPSYRYLGDDQYWRFGIYNNPHDSRLFLPDRIGMNMGINFGRPIGKLLLGLTGLLITAAMLFTIIPAYLYDFTSDPFQLEVSQQQVEITAPFAPTADFSLEDISKLELVDDVTGSIIRTNGSSSTNYSTGRYRVDGKAAFFYINHRSSPILHIETDERDYYYTNKVPEKTKEIYEQLQSQESQEK